VIVLVCLESAAPSLASQAALHLASTLGETSETVVLWASGERQDSALDWLRPCAAVRRIVHLQDGLLAKADFVTLGMILAETARHLKAMVILTGEHSDLEGQGMVPAALAHHLKAPYFARVERVELPSREEGPLLLTLRSGGRRCKVASPLPAVLAIPPSGPLPPLEVGKRVIDIELLTLAQVGLDASRIVPRPSLLGDHVPASAPAVCAITFDEAAKILLQGQ